MDKACSTHGEKRTAQRAFVGKPERKRSLGKPIRRWEDNIKIYLRVTGYDSKDWFHLVYEGTSGVVL
jgi:hypothetical protein